MMATGRTDDDWKTPHVSALIDVLLDLDDRAEAERFLRDLCTLGELRDMAQRWAVVRLLDQGLHYAEVSTLTGASTATITRIASWLRHGEGGYQAMLAKRAAAEKKRVAPGSKPSSGKGAASATPRR